MAKKISLDVIEQAKNQEYHAQLSILEYTRYLFNSIKKAKNYYFPLGNEEDVLAELQARMLTKFIYDFDINKIPDGQDELAAIHSFLSLTVRRFLITEIKKQNRNYQQVHTQSISMDAELPNQLGEGKKTTHDVWIIDRYCDANNSPTPEEQLILKDKEKRYWSYIDKYLTESEKMVFCTYVHENLSMEETAEKLGLSEKQIDNAIQRSKRKIKQALDMEEIVDKAFQNDTISHLKTKLEQISPVEELVQQAKEGSEEAFDKLHQQFKNYFLLMYKRFKFKFMEFEDIYQECLVVLNRAIKKYDSEKGATFSTFLYNSLENEMMKIHQANQYNKRKANQFSLSLDAERVNEKGQSISLKDKLPNDDSTNPENAIAKSDLKEAMEYLNEKEKDIINKRFIDELTLEEIGNRYRVTKEAIRKLEVQALEKLKVIMLGENAEIIMRKNISEKQCMMLEYCALPFEERKAELIFLFNKFSEQSVLKVLKKLKKQGFISYEKGWNAERTATLTPKGMKLLKQFHKSVGD